MNELTYYIYTDGIGNQFLTDIDIMEGIEGMSFNDFEELVAVDQLNFEMVYNYVRDLIGTGQIDHLLNANFLLTTLRVLELDELNEFYEYNLKILFDILKERRSTV